MLHKPAAQSGKDHASGHKSRLGVKMFVVYALVYAGFGAINVIKPVLMEKPVLFGVDLASIYGFGLMIIALVLALIYNNKCKNLETALNHDTDAEVK